MVAIGGARDGDSTNSGVVRHVGGSVLGQAEAPVVLIPDSVHWVDDSISQDAGSTRLVLPALSADGTPEPGVTAAAVSETVAIPEPVAREERTTEPAPIAADVDAIDRFLAGSPLAGMGNVFVAAAAMYGIDPRLMPAVALWESSICRHQAAAFNCWGLTSGADSYGRLIFRDFDSYEDAIWAVSRTYGGYGLPTYAALCMWVSGRANCDSDYPGKVIATMEGIR